MLATPTTMAQMAIPRPRKRGSRVRISAMMPKMIPTTPPTKRTTKPMLEAINPATAARFSMVPFSFEQSEVGSVTLVSKCLLHYDKLGFNLLSDVGACDVYGTFVLDLAVGGEPLLAAGEEGVELSRRHLAGKVCVPPDGDQSAKGLAAGNSDALLGRVEFDHGVPGVAGGVPVGVDEGGDVLPRVCEVWHVGHQQELVGVCFEEEVAADLHVVAELLVDVVCDDVRQLLAFFPEPGELL